MAEEEGEERGIEQQLERAVCSRLQHFKDQADSLTLESVRRLLEKDLSLEKFALDAHKRFIRQFLEKQMDGAEESNSKTAMEDENKDVNVSEEEATISPKEHDLKNNAKKPSTGDEEMMEDSPIMGVLTPKSEADTQGSSVSESRIEKAIWDRADHFLANSENITLAGVRRLLEEDLGLDKNTLDPFKKFISQKIDQVLNPPKEAKSVKDVKKKASGKIKKSEKISSEEESESSGGESEKMKDKVKSRKETAPRRKIKKLEEPKKRKISKEIDTDISSKNQKKLVKRQRVEGNDSDGDGSVSEDGQSQSAEVGFSQSLHFRKEKSAPVYGKKVENLKSIIKACGMSIPPSIYKKAKQEPDNKREAFIVKELEGILSREGLSKNPSEKEIKDCKKRKETARELEGIDMSNIISSSRRRSTFSFVTPPKPEIRAKAKKIDGKDIKNKNNKDKEHIDDNEGGEEKKEEGEKKEEEKKEKTEEEAEDKEGDKEEEEEEEDEDDDDEEEEDDESEEFNEGKLSLTSSFFFLIVAYRSPYMLIYANLILKLCNAESLPVSL
ncbi:hypothetical protein BUALT_Bualt01G0115800 [Buddleja alternifolia]|uniref:DEK-C domain-containing protein n=1 Tax=Buddleja alternifolia TaxID=168488 RepID=A0AAV6Y8N5_9LAMI|nr:hypothetical protein BUALT_Bualt01G0115800 [Buddleja alternifolia]